MSASGKQNSVTSGVIWKFGERISAQVVSFLVSLVLARLLEPSHYGSIAILNVFITLANVFVSTGLGSALIQKKDSDDKDFSTVLYINLALSAIIYILLFACAPFVSKMYKSDILTPTLRVMGISLFIAAFNNVQTSYVSKTMQFRLFFFSTIGGTVASAIIGIAMAYLGFGVWALVAQYISNKLFSTIVLFFTISWKPKLLFSFERLKPLFSYGWKLLASDLINNIYLELRSIVIGIKYTTTDLAFYNKGQSLPKLLVYNINSSLQSVLFPMMSKLQNNTKELKEITRKSIKVCSYIIIPVVVLLAICAKSVVQILLTEKWLPCVPFLQLYCIFYIFMPVQSACLQVIKACGKSDLYLKLETIKKIVGTIFLLISMPFGVLGIAVGATLSNIFGALINVIPTKKLLDYKYREQFADYLSGIIPLLFMIIVCYIIGFIRIPDILLVAIQGICGLFIYIAVSHIMKNSSYIYLLNLIKSKIKLK